MNGQDQSVNLTGMLGQIAETAGSMGDAYKPVMQQATKPRGDMSDPAHLRNLAQWASNNGDTAMASQYMTEARRIGTERKAENEKIVKKATDRAVNTAVSAYDAALRSGDPDAIQAAYEEATRVGNDTGRSTIGTISQLEGAQRQREEANYQQGRRDKLVAEENFTTAFNSSLKADMTPEQIQKKIDSAEPRFKEIAQTLGSRQIQFNNQVAQAKERTTDLAAPVSPDFAASSVAAIKDEGVRANFEERLESLKPEGWDENSKTWATQAQRRRYQQQIDALAKEAFKAGTDEIVLEGRSERDRSESIANGAAVVARQAISKSDIDAWKGANPDKDVTDGSEWFDMDSNNISYDQVKQLIRQERMDGYYEGLGMDNPNKPRTYDAETLATVPEGWNGGTAAWNALDDDEKTEYLNG